MASHVFLGLFCSVSSSAMTRRRNKLVALQPWQHIGISDGDRQKPELEQKQG